MTFVWPLINILEKKSEGFIEVGHFHSFTRSKCVSLICGLRDCVFVWRAWSSWDWLAAWFSIPHIPESGFRNQKYELPVQDGFTDRATEIYWCRNIYREPPLSVCWLLLGRSSSVDFLFSLLLPAAGNKVNESHETQPYSSFVALKTNNELKETKNEFFFFFFFSICPERRPQVFPFQLPHDSQSTWAASTCEVIPLCCSLVWLEPQDGLWVRQKQAGLVYC